MPTPATLSPTRPQIEVSNPRTPIEWTAARIRIRELFTWLEEVSGTPVPVAQPEALRELDELSKVYSPPSGQMIVARVDGQVVGTTAVKQLEAGVFELKRVYVSPEHRGLGLASKMLEVALIEARELGASRIVLESHREAMPGAVAMYERRGFREIASYSDLQRTVAGVVSMELIFAA